MTVSSFPQVLSKYAKDNIIQLYTSYNTLHTSNWNIRERLEAADRMYQREVDNSRDNALAKAANRAGNSDRFQNICVPVVMPQVEAGVTYQASVFLTGVPLFGVNASPQYQDAAMAMQALISDQAVKGAWVRNLLMFFRDGFKYNISFLEASWEEIITAQLETDFSVSANVAKPKKVIWAGNKLKRLDPYNTIWDSRVPLADLHKRGEFAGYTEIISRVELIKYIKSLPDKQLAEAEKALREAPNSVGLGTTGDYYIPSINPSSSLDTMRGIDWGVVTGFKIEGGSGLSINAAYQRTTLYVRLIPKDLGIIAPDADTPQIWKLVLINHSLVIYAERQTNAHDYLPILGGQPLEDGLSYQTKSLAENAEPFQSVATALMNSVIHARRRALTDRVLFDPSRITAKDINNPNPSAKIPVRPSAYGTEISKAVYQFPYRDDQSAIALSEIQQLQGMANLTNGQNPNRQGQFVKGNKTQKEYADTMANSNGRDQLIALNYEDQVFTPLKEILKINILQYQGGTEVYDPLTKENIKVDPVELRKAVMEFKVSDGLIPSDKLMNSETLAVVLQQLGSSPQLGAGFNLASMFSYLVKTQGADISEFEKSPEQVAYEQAVGQWQQAVAGISEQLTKLAPDEAKKLMESIPKQPLPQDFKYDPNVTRPQPKTLANVAQPSANQSQGNVTK